MTDRTMELARPRAKTLGLVLGFAAAAALAAQVAVPVPGTPVPLALAPMAVVLAGLWLGPRAGAASMALYVLAGAAGLPVFAPVGLPGLARLLGPTGGYLLAYPLAAAVTGLVAQRFPRGAGRIAAAALGMVVIHAGGVAQLALLTGSVTTAAALGSAPFLVADAVKAVVAGLISAGARAARVSVRGFFYAPNGALRAVWRILAFSLISVPLAIVISKVAPSGWSAPGPLVMVGRMTRQFIVMLLALAIGTAIMLVFVDKRPWSSVGLGAKEAAPKILGAGLALGALGILLPSGVLLMAHWLQPAPATLQSVGSGAFALQLAVLFLPQSLAEEMLSRGYIFAAIRGGAGDWWAIGITSLLFAALHLDNPGANPGSFAAVLLAGVFLGLIVVVTGSLWAAWMAHFAWNFSILAILHAPVSGVGLPTPGYSVIDNGPDWATGGSWGPEGGVAAAAGMLACIAALLVWQKRRPIATPELAHG